MAQPTPLMPHATASWLVDNTSLSFEQIAEFCGIHILEVQAMADDLAGSKYTGRDPVHSGELTHEEIAKGHADPSYHLKMQTRSGRRQPDQRPALHAGLEAAGQARRHRLDPAQPPGNLRRADRQADRHDAQHDQRDSRPHALEHPEHPGQGPGHARPVLAARARCGGRQGRQARRPSGEAEEAVVESRDDRADLIAELRAERDAAAKAAVEAAQEAEAETWLAAKRAAEAGGTPA